MNKISIRKSEKIVMFKLRFLTSFDLYRLKDFVKRIIVIEYLVPDEVAAGEGLTFKVVAVFIDDGCIGRLWRWRELILPDPDEWPEPHPISRSTEPWVLRRPARSPACFNTWYIRSTSSPLSKTVRVSEGVRNFDCLQYDVYNRRFSLRIHH